MAADLLSVSTAGGRRGTTAGALRASVAGKCEVLRQRSLTEREIRVDKDLVEAKQRHVVARDEFRQQRERGFELSVKQEINRLRVRGPSMGM